VSGARLMSAAFLVTWLAASVRLAGPVLLAALGETFAERGGVLNVGIEGTILLGALSSFLVSLFTGMTWMALLVAMIVGLLASTFLAWMYVSVKASQVVVGLVFNVLALGVASTIYRGALGHSAIPESIAMFHPLHLPLLSDLPLIGAVLFGQTALLYLTLALVAVAQVVLFRTHFGLALRASGENPAAAESAGISVNRLRYVGVLISGATAGMAGAYIVLAQVGVFRESIVSGQGFIALAIVIFGRWNPLKAAGAALVFGACDALQLSFQIFGTRIPSQFLLALPYLVTMVAISGLFGSKAIQPAALMIPYAKD
jgi:ABC-type uncharacterized transport system permease subunit